MVEITILLEVRVFQVYLFALSACVGLECVHE